MRRVLTLVVLCLAACATKSATKAAPTPTPLQSDGAFAPRLFTVEQLRTGLPVGRVIELRMQKGSEPAVVDHWEVTAADADGATIHSTTRDEAGKQIADETGTSKWSELHDHAKFVAAQTRIVDNVTLTVPAGTFKTRLYVVTPDAKTVRRFWFATELPGPPVKFTTEKDGVVVFSAEMVRAK